MGEDQSHRRVAGQLRSCIQLRHCHAGALYHEPGYQNSQQETVHDVVIFGGVQAVRADHKPPDQQAHQRYDRHQAGYVQHQSETAVEVALQEYGVEEGIREIRLGHHQQRADEEDQETPEEGGMGDAGQPDLHYLDLSQGVDQETAHTPAQISQTVYRPTPPVYPYPPIEPPCQKSHGQHSQHVHDRHHTVAHVPVDLPGCLQTHLLESLILQRHYSISSGHGRYSQPRGLGEQAVAVKTGRDQLGPIEDLVFLAQVIVLQPLQRYLGHANPHETHSHQPEHAQIVGSSSSSLLRISQALLGNPGCSLLQFTKRFGQRANELLHLRIFSVFLQKLGDRMKEAAQQTAGVKAHLPPHQIQALDTVGAFINLANAGIPHILLHAGLPYVAVAPVNLHSQVGHLEADVGEERLDHGSQEGHQIIGFLSDLRIRVLLSQIKVQAGPVSQRPVTLIIGLHGEQHAAHIGVHYQRIGGLFRILGTGERAALGPGLRILQTVLVGDLSQTQALHPHSQPSLIHHGEHVPHTPVLLSHQVAHCSIEANLAGGGTLDAHLLLQRPTGHTIPLAQRAVILDPVLGHQKEAYPLDTGGCVREAGQNQMNDVLREVMVPGGDEYLVSLDQVTAVLLGLSFGANQAQVGSAMGFGQTHSARPATVHQPRQELVLELIRPVQTNGIVRPGRQ